MGSAAKCILTEFIMADHDKFVFNSAFDQFRTMTPIDVVDIPRRGVYHFTVL